MDPTETNVITEKIFEVFQTFLEPDFNADHKTSLLEKCFALLTNRAYEIQHDFNFYAEWLREAVDVWKNEGEIPKTGLLVFATKLATFVAKNNKPFLRKKRLLARLLETAKSAFSDPSVKYAYVDLIAAISEVADGVKLSLTESPYWIDIINIADNKNENFDKLCQSITSLLETAAKLDEKICENLLKTILEPVFDVKSITSKEQYGKRRSSIISVVAIAERLFENSVEIVLQIFLDLDIIGACQNILKLKEPPFWPQFNRILVILCLFKMTKAFEGIKEISEDPLALCGIITIVERYIWSENVPDLLEFCYYATMYWKKVAEKLPTHFIKDQRLIPDRELVRLQIMPVTMTAVKFMNRKEMDYMVEADIVRISYYAKMFAHSSVKFSEVCNPLRKLYKKYPLFTYETRAIEFVIKSITLYTQEDAIQVLNALIYALDDYLKFCDKKEVNLHETSAVEQRFLAILLKAIFEILSSFELSWKDCLPIINIIASTLRILTDEYWTVPEVTRFALNVLTVTISKNMAPNMIILEDTAMDLCVVDIQALLHCKCLDKDSEIRKAALEVLAAIAQKAAADFPAFEEILNHKPVVELVVQISSQDPIVTVREKAIRCIQNMLQVRNIAGQLRTTDIIDMTLAIITAEGDNPEIGIEALKLITKIYERFETAETDTWKIYENMVCTRFRDTDSKTKKHIVNFWGKVIDKQLLDHGLAHGEFPSAIFSKERRKIINIDKDEVTTRLLTAVSEANCTGCFAVLFHILKNKYVSVAVIDKVLKIFDDLRSLFKKYKISPATVEVYQSLDSSILLSAPHHSGTPPWCLPTFEDEVELGSLLDDVDLKLPSSPASQLTCYESETTSGNETKFPTCVEVLQYIFDESQIQSEKTNVMNRLEVLLNTILSDICDK